MNRYGAIGAVVAASLACGGGAPGAPEAPIDAAPTADGIALPAAPVVAGPPGAVDGGCTPGAPEVTYKGGVVTATYCPNVEADAELYAGATVIKEDGTRHDLKFVTVPLDQRGAPVTLTEDVGPGYEGWATVVWSQKEDCRPNGDLPGDGDGCALYGVWLDGPVWSPEGWDGWDVLPFTEFKPVRVQLVDAGGGAAGVAAAKALVGDLPVVDGGTANTQRDFVEIMYRRPRYRSEADALASKLTGHVVVREWRDAPEAIVVAVGK